MAVGSGVRRYKQIGIGLTRLRSQIHYVLDRDVFMRRDDESGALRPLFYQQLDIVSKANEVLGFELPADLADHLLNQFELRFV